MMERFIWLLTAPEEYHDWDAMAAIVVASPDEEDARSIAASNCRDEAPGVWRTSATCTKIGIALGDVPDVVCRDIMEG